MTAVPPPHIHSREAVLSANAAFYRAFEALDVDAMARAWSEVSPISCVHPGWTLLSGRDAVLASWTGIFRGTDRIRFELREPHVFLAGTSAWVVLVEAMEAQHGERVVRALALSTNVFVLEGDSWRMVHHHAAPAPQEVAAAPEPSRVLH